VDAATRLPADLLGRPELGRIAPGAVADLVWLGDDLSTRAAWIGGELAYRGSDLPADGRLGAGAMLKAGRP
jgi:N-acetylglucosamine-6-phosphate deacetylase